MQLIMFTGEGCGLCDQAEALLQQSHGELAKSLKKVNVRDNTELYHRYGARIPVFYREDTEQELAWPFESFQLVEFLR